MTFWLTAAIIPFSFTGTAPGGLPGLCVGQRVRPEEEMDPLDWSLPPAPPSPKFNPVFKRDP